MFLRKVKNGHHCILVMPRRSLNCISYHSGSATDISEMHMLITKHECQVEIFKEKGQMMS